MIIDCGSCAMAGLACDDCVVSVLLGMPEAVSASDEAAAPGAPWRHEVPDEHAAALSVLADSGLVPPLRLVPRTQAS